EKETEYVVSAVKHVFKEHIVLQFNIKNTLQDTLLENITVLSTPAEQEDEEGVSAQLVDDFVIPIAKLATDETGIVYVSFKREEVEDEEGEGASYATTTFQNTLKFTSKEV